MKREDQVWALVSVLFGATTLGSMFLISPPYPNLNLLMACITLSAVLGVASGVMAFIKKSLRPLATFGILSGVLYFLAIPMTYFAVASM